MSAIVTFISIVIQIGAVNWAIIIVYHFTTICTTKFTTRVFIGTAATKKIINCSNDNN